MEDAARTPEQTRRSIAIEHAEPCKIRNYADGGRPLLVISRAMSEGNLASKQVACLRSKGVDEVRQLLAARWFCKRGASSVKGV